MTGEAKADGSESVCTATVEQKSEDSPAQEKCKNKLKIPGILKKHKKTDVPDIPGTSKRFSLNYKYFLTKLQ